MVRTHPKIICFLFIVLFPSFVFAQAARIELTPSSGTSDDTFRFSVIVSGGKRHSAPLLTGGEDFSLDFSGSSSGMHIINGVMNASTRYNYQLTPKKTGTLTTPGVEIEIEGQKEVLAPISVVVSEGTSPQPDSDATDPNSDLHISTLGDSVTLKHYLDNNTPFVGEQIVAALELSTKVSLYEPSFPQSTYDGFWSESFGDIEQFERRIGGTVHQVLRRRTALYPVNKGELTLPNEIILFKTRDSRPSFRDPFGSGDPFDFFFGSALQEQKLSTKPLLVNVRELPAAPTDLHNSTSSSIIVGKTSLSVSKTPHSLKVGDNFTLQIEVNSFGNLNPLKNINLTLPAEFKVYEENPEQSLKENSGKLLFKKIFRLTLVPLSGGDFVIPSPKLSYFDPETAQYLVASSEDLHLSVIGEKTKPAEIQNSTQPVGPIPTKPPIYNPASKLELILESLSFKSILFVAVIIVGTTFIVWRIIHNRKLTIPEKKRLALVRTANDIHTLWQSFADFIAHTYHIPHTQLSGAGLRKLFEEHHLPADLQFHLLEAIDEFERLRFGGGSDSSLEVLRRKILKLMGGEG